MIVRHLPRRRMLGLGVILCMIILLSGCGRSAKSAQGNGLFSRQADMLEASRRTELFQAMAAQKLTEVYQVIPSDASPDAVRSFTEDAKAQGLSIYRLAGEPEWGLDPYGLEMIEAVQQAAAFGGLRGVMIDVEPHLLDQWTTDRETVMKSYVQAMRLARQAADRVGLEFIACVPDYYESPDLLPYLQTLVSDGCHRLAIVGSSRSNEAMQIETVATLLMEHEMPLIHVYQLQPPGQDGLTEENTYYGEGLAAVQESWKALKSAYPELSMYYAIQDYDALTEVLSRE